MSSPRGSETRVVCGCENANGPQANAHDDATDSSSLLPKISAGKADGAVDASAQSSSESASLSSSLSTASCVGCVASSTEGRGSWLPLPRDGWNCALSSLICSSLRSCSALPMGLCFLGRLGFASGCTSGSSTGSGGGGGFSCTFRCGKALVTISYRSRRALWDSWSISSSSSPDADSCHVTVSQRRAAAG